MPNNSDPCPVPGRPLTGPRSRCPARAGNSAVPAPRCWSEASTCARPAGRAADAAAPGEDVMHGDLRDPAVVDRLLEGVDVLIHMAGTSVERPLPEIIENNLGACTRSTRARAGTGCKRIVFASSNHAIGMYPVDEKLDLDCALPARRLLRPEQGVGRGDGRGCTGTSTASRASSCGSAARCRGRPSSATSAPGSATTTCCS